MSLLKNPGRLVGLLYVVISIPGFFALLYVPGKVIVRGDATATAHNILASESLFRLGITTDLISQALFILVALALYDLLKDVNRWLARLMLILILIPVAIVFMAEANALLAIRLVRGANYLSLFDEPQRNALAMLFLNLRGFGFDVAQIFWAVWLLPLGMLVYRSGFVPRILGILVIVACCAYMANSFTTLVAPEYERLVGRWASPVKLLELTFPLWLLIAGATPKPSPPS